MPNPLNLNRNTIDPVVVGCTGTGTTSSSIFQKKFEVNGSPGILQLGLVNVTGSFSALQFNVEYTANFASPNWEVIGVWNPLTMGVGFFPISEQGFFRLNCVDFTGGTSVDVYATIGLPAGSVTAGGGTASHVIVDSGTISISGQPIAVNLNDGSGNPISSTSGSLNVNVTNATSSTVNQGNQGTIAESWYVALTDNSSNILGVSATPLYVRGNVGIAGPVSANIISWDGQPLGAPSNYGTSPGAVNVPGVNAFVTNTVTVTGTVQAAQSGNWNVGVSGDDADNAVNSTKKLPVIPARANASAPSWTEGHEVPLSTDLAGNLRVIASGVTSTQYQDGTAESAGAFTGTVALSYNGTDVVGLRSDASDNLLVNVNVALPAGSNLIGGTNLYLSGTEVGLGTQTAANSVPVALPTATITTLTPPTAAAIGTAVSGDLLIGTQVAGSSVPVALPTATITTLTPPTAAAIAAAIVANPPTTFNGVVTNAGTFAVQDQHVSAATAGYQFLTDGTNVIGVSAHPLYVQGTVAATQSGSWTVAATQSGTWTVNVTGTPSSNITEWASTTLGAPTAWNTMPSGDVIGVNASTNPAWSWNTGTAQGTTAGNTQVLFNGKVYQSVYLQVVMTSTLTTGAFTLQGTVDGSTWADLSEQQIFLAASNPGQFVQQNLFNVNPNTTLALSVNMNGLQGLRVRTSTNISGTGTVTPNWMTLNFSPVVYTRSDIYGQYNSSLPSVGTGTANIIQIDAAGQQLVDLNYYAGSALGAPSNYGTSPGAVAVMGVNAFITNASSIGSTQYVDGTAESSGAFTGTVVMSYNGTDVVGLRSDASDNLLVKVNVALPAGTNVIGHVISDSGSVTAATQSGTWTVATNADGSLSGGSAGSKSLAVGGVYNSSAPTLTNGQQSSLQLNSSGALVVTGAGGGTQYTDETAETAGAFTVTAAGLYNGTDVVGLRGDASNNLYCNINAQSLTALKVSATSSANAKTNPIFTQIADGTNDVILVNNGSPPDVLKYALPVMAGLYASVGGTLTGITGTSTSLNVNITGGGGTQYATGTAVATPTGTAALGWDGTDVRVLSTNSSGQLNVIFPSAQAVTLTSTTITGTVAVTQSTSPWTVQGDAAAGSNVAGNPILMGGSDYGGTAKAQTLKVDSSGQIYIGNSSIAVTGTFWQTTQPVSGTVAVSNSFALDTSVNGILVAQGSTTSGQSGPIIQGAVTTNAPTYTTGKTDPLSLTTAGALRVDGSGVTQPVSGTFWQATQPVSGTVAVTQSTSPWVVSGSGVFEVAPTGSANTASNPFFNSIVQGGNTASVKPAETGAAAGDSALVVTESPMNGIPNVTLNNGGTSATSTKTISQTGVAVAAHQTVIVAFGSANWAASNWAVACSDGTNTYVLDNSNEQGTTAYAAIFRATNCQAGTYTITVTISGSSSSNTSLNINAYVVDGLLLPASPLDQTAVGANSGSTAASTSAVYPQGPNEFAVTALEIHGSSTTTATGGWTNDFSHNDSGAGIASFSSASQISPAMGSLAGSITLGTSSAWAMALATYRTPAENVEGTVQLEGQGNIATVKAASTQSAATDTSVIVQLNPNQPNLTTALNVETVSGSTTAVTQSTASNLKGEMVLLDSGGTNLGTIKAASTASATTDTSLVVSQNPLSQASLLGYVMDSTGVLRAISTATFTTSSSGTASVVAASGSTKIYVLSYKVSVNGITNVNLQSHTTTTNTSGIDYFIANQGAVYPHNLGTWITTTAGEGLDINNSQAIAISGFVTYVQF